MMLLEKTYRVTAVHRKSSSDAFKDLNVGDLVNFSIPLSPVGRGGSGSYAAYVSCTNLQTGKESKLSFNQISKTLELFDWDVYNG